MLELEGFGEGLPLQEDLVKDGVVSAQEFADELGLVGGELVEGEVVEQLQRNLHLALGEILHQPHRLRVPPRRFTPLHQRIHLLLLQPFLIHSNLTIIIYNVIYHK